MINTQLPQHTIKCLYSRWQPNAVPSGSNIEPRSQAPRAERAGRGWGANREAERTSDLTPALCFGELSIFLSLGFPLVKSGQQHLLSHIGSFGLEKQALLSTFGNFLKRF